LSPSPQPGTARAWADQRVVHDDRSNWFAPVRRRRGQIKRKSNVMDAQFDRIVRNAARGLDRRRALAGLGAVALGALGLAAGRESASAQAEPSRALDRCRDRCQTHCPNKAKPNRCLRKCKDKCRRRHSR
jgi:hypothetical protein